MIVALIGLLAILAVFQIALAAGAPFGHLAWGGQNRILPARQRVGSVVSVVIYAAIAVIALGRAGQTDLVLAAISQVGMWIVLGFFVLSIVGNAVSRSRFERSVMVPMSAALAVLSLLVAVS